MNYSLTAEQIEQNWLQFNKNIETYITGERKDKLLALYEKMEDHIVLAPAAATRANHNCIPGGYVDHINRVLDAALELNKVWRHGFSAKQDFTEEELAFVCINHDLGKLGLPGIPGTFPNDNDWEIQKLGKMYKFNTTLPFYTVPDRSIFVLQSEGITMTQNEYLGIKVHDGLYEEANKAYFMSFQTEARFRTYLPILIHHADMLASRVEWEREWLPELSKPVSEKPKPVAKPVSKPSSPKASQEALKRLGNTNPGIMNALKGL